MPVVARGNGFQATVHYQGKRYRKSFRSKAEANAWEMQTKAALMRGEIVDESVKGVNRGPATLQELLEITYRRYWKGAPSEKSATLNAKKCVEALGPKLPPAAVDETKLDDMIFSFEAEGISDSTINRRLSALSKMLTHAFERGHIPRKPKIERKKEPQHRIRYITEDEEAELLAFYEYINQPDMVDLVKVGIDTGMRIGEILNAHPRDISKGEVWTISLWKTKSRKSRGIPLTERSREVLERRMKENPNERFFEDWTYPRVRHYWDHARSHMGLMRDPQFVPHTMRHTFCSRLVQRGIDIVTVSKLAGHSSVTMTMRYAHLSPNNLVHAIQALQAPNPAEDHNLREHATPQTCGAPVV